MYPNSVQQFFPLAVWTHRSDVFIPGTFVINLWNSGLLGIKLFIPFSWFFLVAVSHITYSTKFLSFCKTELQINVTSLSKVCSPPSPNRKYVRIQQTLNVPMVVHFGSALLYFQFIPISSAWVFHYINFFVGQCHII